MELGASAGRSGPDPPSAQPTRVAVNETAIRTTGELCWLYAAIDVESKLLLGVELFGRCGTDPAAAFLHGLTEKHDLSDAVFLVDGYGYLTVLSRLGLSVGSNTLTETTSKTVPFRVFKSGVRPSDLA